MSLPPGWSEVPVRELGTWRGGGTPSKANPEFWSGSIPWVSAKDMKVFHLRDTEDHITEEAVAGSSTTIVDPGTVLLVTRSGILKHSLPVAVAKVPAAINQDLKALSVQDGLNPDYVAWAFRGAAQRILHECSKDGTTVQSIEFSRFKEFTIPVAPPTEQRRIVEAIEEQFSRLDAAEESLARAELKGKPLRTAVLASAVSGAIVGVDATSWPTHTVEELATDVRYGTSKKTSGSGGVPVLRMGNVVDGRLRWAKSVVSQQVGQANINGTKLKAMEIPVPPVDIQKEIVQKVEQALSLEDALLDRVSAARRSGLALRRAVLKEAFAGRLVNILASPAT